MPSVAQVTADHYKAQQTLARQTVEQAQTLWARVQPAAVVDSWIAQLAEMIRVLTLGQAGAAAMAQPYVEALAAAQGIPSAAGVVNAAAFAGIAADGRDLAGLLMQPALRTLGVLATGADDQTALLSGLESLTRIVDTEISDASRAADHVGMVANRRWVTYVRHVTLPACGRCIILAGRTYSWSQGFQRHPRCDCTMVPHHEGDTPPPSPEELFAQMNEDEQARAFTVSGAEAIRLGADMGQVVNARRGMQTIAGGRLVTTEGTTSRGYAGKKLGDLRKVRGERYRRSQVVRPMPEQLLADARDRDEAIRFLERFGYLDRTSVRRRERAGAAAVSAAAVRRDAEDAARRQRDAEANARRQAEETRRAAEQARREAEEKARREAEEKRAAEDAARRAAEAARWSPASTMTHEQAAAMQRSMPAWTRTQRDALQDYTGGWAGPVNDALRKGKPIPDRFADLRNAVTNLAAAVHPLPRPVTVYRYVAPDAFGRGRTRADKLGNLVGRTLQDRGFMSTSLARSGHTDPAGQMALGARRQVLMEIDVPAGARAAYIDEVSVHPGQWELLLGPGTKYEVVEVVQDGAHTVVRVRVVP
ncbi:VG15 protein [Sphaerimonospora thailandensis]|uniref:ADP ribosyltransferase domain-containing protein n=1 Tax=Sphaerimonospora thailandensis TaxID=795644 RepID=A0A8J3R947_9ACTN|nr:ADP-ribosyltransferase [Sphaerimonospora thailandensis]GIH70334.1 hypothetical protein Mth01_25870 [Sphaerimonospora thailandensis]